MKVVLISGPTATGKTEISLDLAKKFGGEIVNFDSLLLYKELNIGTAKPTLEERKTVPHHMIDVTSISHPLNVSEYSKNALPIINGLLAKGKLVFLVGGSGFYLQALLKGMFDSPTTPQEIKVKSDEMYRAEGISPFLKILEKVDPISFKRYHANDHYRVRRAVEHYWTHSTPLSSLREIKDQENATLNSASIHGWEVLHIHLDIPKEEHWEIIKKRTEKMLANGLIKEVDEILAQGFKGSERPLQSIGYKEILELKFGVLRSLTECQERINISTRQLAKSQRTWFSRTPGINPFNPLKSKDKIHQMVEDFVHL